MKKKMQIIIAKQNHYTEKREKERDLTILVVVTGLLQFYKFLIISRIEDDVRHKFSCLKILISVSCICFLNKFLLADFSIFSGKKFHSHPPNRENDSLVVQDEKT